MNDFIKTCKSLDAFTRLKTHWSYGEGERISSNCIDRAKSLLLYAQQYAFDGSAAFPNTDGGCAICFYYQTDDINSLEIHCHPDGTYEGAWEYGRGFDFKTLPVPDGLWTEPQTLRVIDWFWDELHRIKTS